jgi:hypothetical protein
MQQSLTSVEPRDRPSPIDFGVAYQARVALESIRLAIKHIERVAQGSEQVREVSLLMQDALDRVDELDSQFQTRSRIRVLPRSANGTESGA